MGDSLRDQLLKAGFAAKPRGEKPQRHARSGPEKAAAAKSRERDFDLARAYAIRARAEKSEREAAAREAERQAQERRERKRKLHELLEGKSLNLAEAELVRHFEHAGKIRRIHVDAAQLARLNAGELGVVVQAGRFILVERTIAAQVRDFAPEAVVLLVDLDAPADSSDDDVPDDLVW